MPKKPATNVKRRRKITTRKKKPLQGLAEYRRKRHFKKTPEPATSKRSEKQEPIFVVHKHDATALHYDFRLAYRHVLKSWAIPKGFSTNPKDKHLAIQTEDHPYDYAQFEGVIPEGEYGAGPVMIWDYGTYRNIKKESMGQCLKDGRVEVELHGKKLHGLWALVRTKLYQGKGKESWLLIKMHDTDAGKKIANQNKSALTGRTMKQISDFASDKLRRD